ncbi:SH3-containing GRB2-like protein 3-interacting protein 1 [Ataeniobius toweri]|uniref:SH3-containing GRB2-like protein 3-interacting protein 1 n=1 Tax=Ataeniobius toweri TaxID=208326 RepID=A0ABU7AC67_9TELE|nr:SH3-containing GRB2-like protein 3-interacting protein 1 [Ataeniobius toweri]
MQISWMVLCLDIFLDFVPSPTKKTHFFSSDESEEEEDHKKKMFKIKIKPLPADCVIAAASVDELKASIGNIALSPSPMGLKRNTSSEEIARPRRAVPAAPTVAPTPAPAPQPPRFAKSIRFKATFHSSHICKSFGTSLPPRHI